MIYDVGSCFILFERKFSWRISSACKIEKQIKTIEDLFDYCLFYLDLFTLSIKLKWGTQKAYISKVKKLNHRS
jgi:hypothetical protein